jgi:hypothetical protein
MSNIHKQTINVILFVVLFVTIVFATPFLFSSLIVSLISTSSIGLLIANYLIPLVGVIITLCIYHFVHIKTEVHLPENIRQANSRNRARWLGIALTSTTVLLLLFLESSIFIYNFSGCEGGVGSGISCSGPLESLVITTQWFSFIFSLVGGGIYLLSILYLGLFFLARYDLKKALVVIIILVLIIGMSRYVRYQAALEATQQRQVETMVLQKDFVHEDTRLNLYGQRNSGILNDHSMEFVFDFDRPQGEQRRVYRFMFDYNEEVLNEIESEESLRMQLLFRPTSINQQQAETIDETPILVAEFLPGEKEVVVDLSTLAEEGVLPRGPYFKIMVRPALTNNYCPIQNDSQSFDSFQSCVEAMDEEELEQARDFINTLRSNIYESSGGYGFRL